ncbi:HAD family hydrolase [Pseudonocardia sp.]|jgi:hypothetical protein|uniref:HAD family hydrolase n=1 Tax=Pseudonocardia sp. TaxID=60912 RepID=UPI0031FD2A0E
MTTVATTEMTTVTTAETTLGTTTGSRPVVCLDLDRTTIYSAAALGLRGPDQHAPRLLCVEVYNGVPQSFMTEEAVDAFRALQDAAVVVPTTTRTPEQLARVHLPGPPARFAIASNGGHLLVDGEIDPGWSVTVHDQLTGCAPLAEVETHIQARGGTFVLRLHTASNLFCYAVVDRPALPPGWVEALAAWCGPRGWMVSLQGRKVYAVPVGLTKSSAAAEVLRRSGADQLLAAGDSLLDADLLDAAALAIRPAHGELADTGFTRPHLAVTTATGAAAGAELLTWLCDRASIVALSVSGRV